MRIEKTSSTVFTPLSDGTGVLLNLNTLFYYSLNRTAALLWQQIEKENAVTLDELVRQTCERFDVGQDEARHSLGSFIEKLEQYKMVRLA